MGPLLAWDVCQQPFPFSAMHVRRLVPSDNRSPWQPASEGITSSDYGGAETGSLPMSPFTPPSSGPIKVTGQRKAGLWW